MRVEIFVRTEEAKTFKYPSFSIKIFTMLHMSIIEEEVDFFLEGSGK